MLFREGVVVGPSRTKGLPTANAYNIHVNGCQRNRRDVQKVPKEGAEVSQFAVSEYPHPWALLPRQYVERLAG